MHKLSNRQISLVPSSSPDSGEQGGEDEKESETEKRSEWKKAESGAQNDRQPGTTFIAFAPTAPLVSSRFEILNRTIPPIRSNEVLIVNRGAKAERLAARVVEGWIQFSKMVLWMLRSNVLEKGRDILPPRLACSKVSRI